MGGSMRAARGCGICIGFVLSATSIARAAFVWKTPPVYPSPFNSPMATSSALDLADKPHIAFNIDPDTSLHYASQTPGGWSSETVETGNASYFSTSLDIDSQGRPSIVYNQPFGGVRRA